MNANEAQGRFVWYELFTKDPEGAKKFYPPVTGWTTQKFEGALDYEMWAANGKPFAGVMKLPAEAEAMGAPTHWIGYIETADLDAMWKRAAAMGATGLVPPMDIPNVGRFAILRDPQGASIAFFQSKNPSAEASGAGPICWHELMTSDLEAAWGFYSELFGWQKQQDMEMGPGMVYRIFGVGATAMGGMAKRPAQMPVSAWGYYIEVPKLDAAIEAAKKGGATLINGPMDVPGGRIANLVDPQGGMFALHTAAAQS